VSRSSLSGSGTSTSGATWLRTAYLTQRKLLTRDLEALPIADDRVPPGEAIALASCVGEPWGEMTDDERRRFVEEWFEELRLGRAGTIAVRARETYREIVFSALDAWWRSDPSRQAERPKGGEDVRDDAAHNVARSVHIAGRRVPLDRLRRIDALTPPWPGPGPSSSPMRASTRRSAPQT